MRASLSERNLGLDGPSAKIVVCIGSPELPQFGLTDAAWADLSATCSLIIHLAWPVNFNIALSSFETHLRGLQQLLVFSLGRKPEPAVLLFGSSVSVADRVTSTIIPEAPIRNLDLAAPMGYAQSKLVGQHMVLRAAQAGARSYVLRIGQVAGDSIHGVWNEKESVPNMIRSVFFMRALPAVDEVCSSHASCYQRLTVP